MAAHIMTLKYRESADVTLTVKPEKGYLTVDVNLGDYAHLLSFTKPELDEFVSLLEMEQFRPGLKEEED